MSCSTTNAPPQLVELRQSKSFGRFDDHDRGSRHINPDLYDRGCQYHLEFTPPKSAGHHFTFVSAKSAVEHTYLEAAESDPNRLLVLLKRCGCNLVGGFDQWVDDVPLSSGFDLRSKKP